MREHQRRHQLKKYGMTIADYDTQFAAQGGKCAICAKPECGPWPDFVVDHDHETGEVRGLLCHRCNVGLGQFEDDPATIAAALRYMERRDWNVARSLGAQLRMDAAC